MNENDLERELRSQRGPREEGYVPAHLPVTLEEAPLPGRRPARLPRVAMLVAAGAAGALAVAIAAGFFSGPGPIPEVGAGSESPSAAQSAAAQSATALPTCGLADVSFIAEPWGAAAGSRGTTVYVTLAAGRQPCTLSHSYDVTAEIRDANGELLVSGTSPTFRPPPIPTIDLEPGAAYISGIAWSNWCGDDPAAPVRLSLELVARFAAVAVDVPAGVNPVPPCNGVGQPSSLSVTSLQPAP
jgi:Domain of unknown function (DUF4232)